MPDPLETLAGGPLTIERRPDPCEPLLLVQGARDACERLTEIARAEQLPDLRLVTAAHCTGSGWCVVLGVWRA